MLSNNNSSDENYKYSMREPDLNIDYKREI